MEIISVKFQEDVLKHIDNSIEQHNFNSRTEFIREAIRDKLKELKKEETLNELQKHFGKSKTKTTFEEDRKIREKVGKEIAGKFVVKLD